MTLPSRPNARLGGLPTGPRSRSFTASSSQREEPRRSASTTRDYARDRTGSSPSEPPAQLRYQRSFSGPSSGRPGGREQEAPPMPPLPTAQRTKVADKLSRLKGDKGGSVTSFSTVSSSSSSSSSGDSGYTSPATSLDEYSQEEKYEEEDMLSEDKPVPPGFGSSLWGRLAAAAGNLSISVTKALDSNGSVSSGESECTAPSLFPMVTWGIEGLFSSVSDASWTRISPDSRDESISHCSSKQAVGLARMVI